MRLSLLLALSVCSVGHAVTISTPLVEWTQPEGDPGEWMEPYNVTVYFSASKGNQTVDWSGPAPIGGNPNVGAPNPGSIVFATKNAPWGAGNYSLYAFTQNVHHSYYDRDMLCIGTDVKVVSGDVFPQMFLSWQISPHNRTALGAVIPIATGKAAEGNRYGEYRGEAARLARAIVRDYFDRKIPKTAEEHEAYRARLRAFIEARDAQQ